MKHQITTAHAVLRYLRRVEGIDITAIKQAMIRMGIEDMADTSVLAFIYAYTCVDIASVNRAINCRAVFEAVRIGASAVRINRMRYVIRGGNVVTIETEGRRGRRDFADARKPMAWRSSAIREYRDGAI